MTPLLLVELTCDMCRWCVIWVCTCRVLPWAAQAAYITLVSAARGSRGFPRRTPPRSGGACGCRDAFAQARATRTSVRPRAVYGGRHGGQSWLGKGSEGSGQGCPERNGSARTPESADAVQVRQPVAERLGFCSQRARNRCCSPSQPLLLAIALSRYVCGLTGIDISRSA